MRLSTKVRPTRTILSFALLIAGASAAATNLPDAVSNLVVKDDTSVDKVVPSESVAIAYDKSTSLNVPLTPEVDSRAALSSNVPSTSRVHLTSRATLSSSVPTPEVQSTSRAKLTLNIPSTLRVPSISKEAFNSNGPLTSEQHSTSETVLSSIDSPTLEVPSTPKAASSSTPEAPAAAKVDHSSLVSQTSKVVPTPKDGTPTTSQVQLESKADLISSLPPAPSTNAALSSVPRKHSTSQVQSESTAALTSVPEVPTTSHVQSNSKAALNSSLPPTQLTQVDLTSTHEEPRTLSQNTESKAALSSSLPPTQSTKAALTSVSEAASTLQVQPESKEAPSSIPEVPPTFGAQSESKDALSSSLPLIPATKASLKSIPESSPTPQLKSESKAALISAAEVLPTPNLHVSLTEVQSHFKSRNMSSTTSTTSAVNSTSPLISKVTSISIIPSRQNVRMTSEDSASSPSNSPASSAQSSSTSTPIKAVKTFISNTAGQLLRSGYARPFSASTLALFDEADPSAVLRVQRTTPRTFSRQSGPGGCQGEGRCVPLSYCRLLADLLDRSCLISDRLRELTCGYGGREPLVCCPPGGFTSIYPTSPPTYPPPPPPPPPPTSPPPPPAPPPSPFPSKCGIPQVFNWRADYRGLGSQPWVARIGFKSVDSGSMQYPCCGSIISSRVILTAAHCALAKTVGHKLSSVRVGEFDATQDPDCTAAFCAHKVQDVAVSHVVVHPAYERSTFVNDIALLVLRQPLNFTLTTQPICLDGGGNYGPLPYSGYVGTRAKLVGWGMTAGQTDVPELQQQLDLPVVPVDQCARLYDQVVPITSQHMCVGGEPGRDACSGFGGAPLVMLDSSTHTKYYQIAMVSFGSKQCGAPGVPSVYTRIDKYFDWIRANMNY